MFLLLLSLLARPFCAAAESSPPLLVVTMTAHLYARQERESEVITRLAKGEELLLLGQALGISLWYMVKTPKGAIGWVQSAVVSGVSSTEDPMTMELDPSIFRSQSILSAVDDQSGVITQAGYQDPGGHLGPLTSEEQKATDDNIDVQRKESRSSSPYQVIIEPNIRNLAACVAQADAADQARWNKTCALQGEPRGCALRAPVAVDLDQARRAYIDACYKRFPEH